MQHDTLTVDGLDSTVVIERDAYGIPHVRATTLPDLFFGQGFATAADRTWQLEWDLRRAHGTLAAVTGQDAHARTDAFARRARLADVARQGYDALQPGERLPLDAHAAGVAAQHAAALAAGAPLAAELRALGIGASAWRAEHAVAVFQIRHVLFATWQTKLWRARVLAALGPEAVARFNREGLAGDTPVIVPAGVRAAVGELHAARLFDDPDVRAALGALAGLGLHPLPGTGAGPEPGPGGAAAGEAPVPGLDLSGSNAWVVAGTRTTTGLPLLAGDPHRAYEVPNVYYQVRLSCPEEGIEAAGFSFPGVPGIQHFGQNGRVAWGVTNAMADYQDLYVERLPEAVLDERHEQVEVAGGTPVGVDCLLTRHGPVIAGDPERGVGIALASTGLVDPAGSLRTLVPLLRAGSLDELDAALAEWVEPLNNWVMAERGGSHGAIGYRTAGHVPRRPAINAWLPVPGWDARFDWDGAVVDGELPRDRDPGAGAIVTANQRITDRRGNGPLLATDYAAAGRAQRIWDRLGGTDATVAAHSPAAVAAIHGDTVSLAGARFAARSGHALLAGWDGSMDVTSSAAALYATARDHLVRRCCDLLDTLRANPFDAWEPPATALPLEQRVDAALDGWLDARDSTVLPDVDWDAEVRAAVERAAAQLAERFGSDPSGWRWGELHAVTPLHPLRATLGESVRPSSGPIGGGSGCVMATNQLAAITTNALTGSVARYLWDLSDPARSGWIVPLGASGDPSSPHFADQTERYVAVELVDVAGPAVRALRLEPGPRA